MNKGVETLYAPSSTAYSDAQAQHGVTLMARGLLRLRDDRDAGLDDAVAGLVLVQLQRQISVLHAFGRAVSRFSDIQQGIAHAIVSPAALDLMLSLVDLRRDLLAAAFRAAGATSLVDDGAAVLDGFTAVRDGLGLPRRLAEVAGGEALDLDACAAAVSDDPRLAMSPLPEGLTLEQTRSVFESVA